MLPAALITLLQEKIQAHLEESGGKLEKLAEELSVRPTSLRGLLAGNPRAACSASEAFFILRYFLSDQAISVFAQHLPDFTDELLRMESLPRGPSLVSERGDSKQALNIASKVFQSVYHYRLYASTMGEGITRDTVSKKFGPRGIAILDEFIAADIVCANDTCGHRPVSGRHCY